MLWRFIAVYFIYQMQRFLWQQPPQDTTPIDQHLDSIIQRYPDIDTRPLDNEPLPQLDQQLVSIILDPQANEFMNPDVTPSIHIPIHKPMTETIENEIPVIQAFFHPEYVQEIYDVMKPPEFWSPYMVREFKYRDAQYEFLLRDFLLKREITYDSFVFIRNLFAKQAWRVMRLPPVLFKPFLVFKRLNLEGYYSVFFDHTIRLSNGKLVNFRSPNIHSVILVFQDFTTDQQSTHVVSFVKISKTVRNPRIAIYFKTQKQDFYIHVNFASAIDYFFRTYGPNTVLVHSVHAFGIISA
jgi:hypothetical protein